MAQLEPIRHAYLRSDLRNAIDAAALAGRQHGGDYGAGYADALRVVAVMFGMSDCPALGPTVVDVQARRLGGG